MVSVLVAGAFNVIHPGHMRLLRFAKESGDRLIVAVQSDRSAAKAAYVPESDRLEGVKSNKCVDECFITDESIMEVIERIRPDIVVKGKEHEFGANSERELVEGYGGRLVFSSGETIWSAKELLQREFADIARPQFSIPKDYMDRRNVSISDIGKVIDQFKELKVSVIGDLIVDEYITCKPLGMSQEDATVVVAPTDTTRFVGGAGIVAAHCVGLGAHASLMSVVGDDAGGRFGLETLRSYGVQSHLVIDDDRPTTVKQRYRCNGKSLLRVNRLYQGGISIRCQNELLTALQSNITSTDLIILSDFNYGCLTQPFVDEVTKLAKEHDAIIVADSQSSSQIGNVCRFLDMDLITPTEHEARLSTHNQQDGLVVLSEEVRKRSNAKNILLTLGAEGLLVHSSSELGGLYHNDQIGALNSNPKDVAGAGDALLVATSLTLARGGSIWEAALIGSIAAAMQVSTIGNLPLEFAEMQKCMLECAQFY